MYKLTFPILEFDKVDRNNHYYSTEVVRGMFEVMKRNNIKIIPVVFVNRIDVHNFLSMSPLHFAGFAKITQGSGKTLFAEIEVSPTPDGLELMKVIESSYDDLEFHVCGIADRHLDPADVIIVDSFELIYITAHPGIYDDQEHLPQFV